MSTCWAGPSECCEMGGLLSVTVISDLGPLVALRVTGDIDMASVSILRDCLDDLIAAGSRILVLDLERVTLFGADALRVLAGVRQRLHPVGGSVHLVCTRRLTVRVLTVTGMLDALPLHRDVPTAIRELSTT